MELLPFFLCEAGIAVPEIGVKKHAVTTSKNTLFMTANILFFFSSVFGEIVDSLIRNRASF